MIRKLLTLNRTMIKDDMQKKIMESLTNIRALLIFRNWNKSNYLALSYKEYKTGFNRFLPWVWTTFIYLNLFPWLTLCWPFLVIGMDRVIEFNQKFCILQRQQPTPVNKPYCKIWIINFCLLLKTTYIITNTQMYHQLIGIEFYPST